MKKREFSDTIFIVVVFILLMGILGLLVFLAHESEVEMTTEEITIEQPSPEIGSEEPSEWDRLIEALIQVESSGDSLAVGKSNDLGALQLTPIYVKEVNRILGSEVYSLDDRLSLKKSIEMFNICQSHHNPSRNIDKAIHLHNPGAGDWYRDRVYSVMGKEI